MGRLFFPVKSTTHKFNLVRNCYSQNIIHRIKWGKLVFIQQDSNFEHSSHQPVKIMTKTLLPIRFSVSPHVHYTLSFKYLFRTGIFYVWYNRKSPVNKQLLSGSEQAVGCSGWKLRLTLHLENHQRPIGIWFLTHIINSNKLINVDCEVDRKTQNRRETFSF